MNVGIFLIVHWFLALFCQSFFLHRYASHRMFKMNIFWERFFYLLTYLTQGPSFLNPTSYSIMHQRHHAYSDTEKDPHSPRYSPSVWHMMKLTYHHYQALLDTLPPLSDDSVKHQSPRWEALDRFSQRRFNLYLWPAFYTSIYFLADAPAISYLLLPLHFFIGPIQGAIVNWCGHKVGYRNFSLQDQSHNALPIDLPLLGELYQNNHHRFANKLNFAYRWFEVDLTYQIAKILQFFSIIKINEKNS